MGDIAGCKRTQHNLIYTAIRIDGVLYSGHQLAWFYVHGKWAVGPLDHKNGDGEFNAMRNLRRASSSQNAANMRKKIKSSTGYRGVYPYGQTGKKFEAKAMKNGRSIRFGVYRSPKVAYGAYVAGMKTLFGNFASVV